MEASRKRPHLFPQGSPFPPFGTSQGDHFGLDWQPSCFLRRGLQRNTARPQTLTFPEFADGSVITLSLGLGQWSPIFLTPGIDFVEGNFFMDLAGGMVFGGMVWG